MADKDDDLMETVTAMADRLKLTGNDRRKYVHDHMTRAGYRMEPTYVPDDDDDDDEPDTPFFGSKRRKSRSGGDDDDDARPKRGKSSSKGSDNWYS